MVEQEVTRSTNTSEARAQTRAEAQAKVNYLTRLYQMDILSHSSNSIQRSSTQDLEEYRASIFNHINREKDSELSSEQVPMLLGQGIVGSHGIQIGCLTRLPVYSNSDSHHIHHRRTTAGSFVESHKIPNSISTSSSSVSSIGILNTKLMRLPICAPGQNEFLIGSTAFNGLKFFPENYVKQKVEDITRKSREKTKDLERPTLPEVEYLHGTVIMNQLLNSKRILRDVQWKQYYNDRMGGHSLRELVTLRNKKSRIISLRQFEIEQKLDLITLKRNQNIALLPQEEDFYNRYSQQNAEEPSTVPKFQSLKRTLTEAERRDDFANNFVFEDEVDMDRQTLINYSNLRNSWNHNVVTLSSINNIRNEDYQTKIVKKRRCPNPNALGYSNIRGVKPPYA
ncbi:Hypothetical protein PP7435_CHR4-0337 [Komagataella phaffii CBS 7435]|uniref:Uncharacterized protein n=2 Tax=Komagataella phaffii TaxID=460519 RepID=C4R8G6_KOMPG|nr:Hypothetical protein PAS_chr4_0631 [Komagataella phaffii GS115]AOA65135.1 GQ67_05007T0 [Komagataella phaffii]CAH2450707.1 Hypothetical protein BQ9382_C4-1760 [Komagataella phaffii CBS 7435]AOA70091.1 GQ68_04988T0 [Komagataella phaffii GS115]CAY71891.1 Hypothetical protein PAS_chr4_0631 [Komagataella phaffii GS115]CCA40507.1 Hypothetical protein PP7435_CHR4-0337 [Komagataella phaffii CBS 7435]